MNIKRLFEKTNTGFKEFIAKVDFANVIGLSEELTKYIKKNSADYVATINPDINVDDEVPKITYIDGDGGINDIYLDLASEDGPGLMTRDDKIKLNNFPNLSSPNILTDIGTYGRSNSFIDLVYKSTSTQTPYPKIRIEAATTTYAGVMTADDKAKLNNIPNTYAKKSNTISNIDINYDFNKRGLYLLIDYADRTNLGTTVNIPNATSTTDGCMSYADKVKLDSIPVKYIPTSDGVINESMTFNKNIYLKDVYITGYISGENLEEGVRFNGCAGIEHFNQDDAIKSKLWNAQGGTIDISEILINAAIYVQGIMTRATGPIDYDSIIDFPDSIIFDITTGVFYAKKNDKLYTRWNAYLGKGIYSPEKYGVVDNNRVYPLPKQMYKFEEDSNLYICSYINNLATMKILTI